MTDYKQIAVYETTFDKISVISTLTKKEKCQLFYELFNALEEALKRSVQNKGELCFNWQMMTKISGTTLQITFVPKIAVKTKKCKPITARFSNKGEFKGVVEK